MVGSKKRSDINDFRNDNFIFNVLDSLQESKKSTGNKSWMREEDLLGNFHLNNFQS